MHALSPEQYEAQVAAIMRAARDPANYPHLAPTAPAYKAPVDPLILEYEQLDQLCAGLSRADEKLVYDAHDAAGFTAALSTAIALKAARTAVAAAHKPAVKTKQAQNPLDAACDRLKERLRRTMGDDAAAAQVDRIADQLDPGTGAIGVQMADDEATFKNDAGRPLFGPVR